MKQFILFLAALSLFACNKKTELNKVIEKFSLNKTLIDADGQSRLTATILLSGAASADRRSIIFKTSAGTFTVSGKNEQTVKAEYENGLLVAKAVIKAPIEPGTIIVTAKPEFDSPLGEYIVTDSARAIVSVPVTINLETSASGIASNHINEVFLSAELRNGSGNSVSKGNAVLFEDELVAGGAAAGSFRNMHAVTGDSSKVSAFYSAPLYPIGTQVKIRATILTPAGLRTDKKDSVILTINL